MSSDLKIDFRLGPPYSTETLERAKRVGKSKNLLVRDIYIAALENTEMLNIRDEVRELREQVVKLCDLLRDVLSMVEVEEDSAAAIHPHAV